LRNSSLASGITVELNGDFTNGRTGPGNGDDLTALTIETAFLTGLDATGTDVDGISNHLNE
jgi:hypothetical protein